MPNEKARGDRSENYRYFYLVKSDLSAVDRVFKLLESLIWVSATARSDRWDSLLLGEDDYLSAPWWFCPRRRWHPWFLCDTSEETVSVARRTRPFPANSVKFWLRMPPHPPFTFWFARKTSSAVFVNVLKNPLICSLAFFPRTLS